MDFGNDMRLGYEANVYISGQGVNKCEEAEDMFNIWSLVKLCEGICSLNAKISCFEGNSILSYRVCIPLWNSPEMNFNFLIVRVLEML